MKLGLHQSARLEQRLIHSPQMIQAMQILQLPSLELEERIEQELTENPFLELQEPDTGADGKPDEVEATREESAGERAETDGLENMLDELERYERDFGDGRARVGSPEEADRKYEAMQNAPSTPHSLAEAILDQVTILELTDRERALVEFLAWSLDEHGYIQEGFENLLASVPLGVVEPPPTRDELAAALIRLREVTHPAMGAEDLRECLLLQLDAHDPPLELAYLLVEQHLDDIRANRLPRIAKRTGASIEEIKEALAAIQHLDPYPGADFGETRATVIHPEVVVEEIEGEYVVRLDREHVPELTLSPAYRQMLASAKRGDGVREWIRKRVESARWFIDAVHQRQSTLHRIAAAIFERQRTFLERGVSGLQPLRMQEVADEIGVHISTVSRGVSGKYAQTPRGIFSLKSFFTGGTTKDTGEVASQASVKERLRLLVEGEDRSAPYSDDQLAALLGERDGIKIARRTVTKYRKALGIDSSGQRREY